MHRELGIDTELVPESEWQQRFPWVVTEGIGAIVFEPNSGYADPVQTAEAFVDSFVRAGGEFRPRTPVRALTGDDGKVTGVLVDDGEIHAGAVVNAAGPWARPLAESVGLDLPLRAVREQDAVWEVRGDRPLPHTPVANAGRGGVHAADGRRPLALRPRLPEALLRRGPLQLQGDVRQRLRGRRLPALVQADPRPRRLPSAARGTLRSTTSPPTGSRSWGRERASTAISMPAAGAATRSRPDRSSPGSWRSGSWTERFATTIAGSATTASHPEMHSTSPSEAIGSDASGAPGRVGLEPIPNTSRFGLRPGPGNPVRIGFGLVPSWASPLQRPENVVTCESWRGASVLPWHEVVQNRHESPAGRRQTNHSCPPKRSERRTGGGERGRGTRAGHGPMNTKMRKGVPP